ncbi:PAS domain S-box protein [Gemmata sp. G18]|uniref:histidine kinase n=1 Tax=Gemmata palustris TaxID=2822762 RepID=A0ABS5BNF9_9BACT|nr:PAS domain S-box protein [Gemmata palustris]MBP3954860.1 PAS domain S-box protein [Gemmata palustris]
MHPLRPRTNRLRDLMPYAWAVLTVAVVAIVRGFLDPLLGQQHAYIFFLFPTLIVANSFGGKPGWFALVLGMMTANYLFLNPRLSFWVEEPIHQVGLLIFLVVGGAGIFLADSRRSAQKRAGASEATLVRSDAEIAALEQQARDLAVSVETLREQARWRSEAEIAALAQQAQDLAVSVETVREVALLQSDNEIAALGQQAGALARSVETGRQQALTRSNERIETLEQKARDLAGLVETARQHALIQSDKKTEGLEQKARDLADYVETLRSKARLKSDAEIAALGTKARDLALFVEAARKETRLQSETEIAGLQQQARDLAVSVEAVREATLLHSDTEIAVLERASDLARSAKAVSDEHRLTEQRAEVKFRLAIESAPNAMVMIERDGKIVLVNVETERLFQYPREELLGQPVELLVPERFRDKHPAYRTGFMAKPEVRAMGVGRDLHGRRKDGTEFPIEIGLNPLVTDEGFFVLSAIVDITERKRAENVLHHAHEEMERRVLERTGELETANKGLEAFSYSVSHDLRAPLRAIDGFSRILLEEHSASLPDQAKLYLKLVRDNARQMAQLVDDLLAFSRLSRLALNKQTVEPGKLVRLCLAEMQKEQEGRHLEIVIGDMPACQGDPTLLKQVWTNLLSNALKYTSKRDAARIEIGCTTEPRPTTGGSASGPAGGTNAVYFVTDNGAGFDMKYADKLFGVFQRLHRAADYDGTGVGLAIVQRIVHRHGGRVWADARLNQGATFSFTLE